MTADREPMILLTGSAVDPYPRLLMPDGYILDVPESPRRMEARREYAAALHNDIHMMLHPDDPGIG